MLNDNLSALGFAAKASKIKTGPLLEEEITLEGSSDCSFAMCCGSQLIHSINPI